MWWEESFSNAVKWNLTKTYYPFCFENFSILDDGFFFLQLSLYVSCFFVCVISQSCDFSWVWIRYVCLVWKVFVLNTYWYWRMLPPDSYLLYSGASSTPSCRTVKPFCHNFLWILNIFFIFFFRSFVLLTNFFFLLSQNSLTIANDPGTSDDSGRASERLTTSSVAPRDADSSRDRLSDVSIVFHIVRVNRFSIFRWSNKRSVDAFESQWKRQWSILPPFIFAQLKVLLWIE